MAAAAPAGLRRLPSSPELVSAYELLTSPAVNPFVNKTWKATSSRAFGCGILLIPLRMLLTLLNIALISIIAVIAVLGHPRKQPLPGWRLWLLAPLRPLIRFQLVILGYYNITTHGKLASRAEAPIIVSNHISFVEPIFLASAALASPVSAAENASYPLVGSILIALQALLVDRAQHGSSGTTEQLVARAKDASFRPQMLVFPEGTCSNGDAVIMFRTGAFVAGVPVQPVAVKYRDTHDFDPSWVSAGPGVGALLLRMMSRVSNGMDVTYLPVHVPTEAERAEPALFARNVQQEIAAVLGADVRATRHSYEDVQLAAIASKAHYPPDKAVAELQSMRAALNIDAKVAGQYLRRFMQADTGKTGKLSYEQFADFFTHARAASALDAPASAEEQDAIMRRLYSIFDVTQDGVDFRSFLAGLAIVNERGVAGRQDALRLAFRMLDEDDDGRVSKDELGRALRRVWPDLTSAQLDEYFASADVDGDGLLRYSEFLDWATKHAEHLSLFRRVFFGFSHELDVLPAVVERTHKAKE